jgi:hypothetical protein
MMKQLLNEHSYTTPTNKYMHIIWGGNRAETDIKVVISQDFLEHDTISFAISKELLDGKTFRIVEF